MVKIMVVLTYPILHARRFAREIPPIIDRIRQMAPFPSDKTGHMERERQKRLVVEMNGMGEVMFLGSIQLGQISLVRRMDEIGF